MPALIKCPRDVEFTGSRASSGAIVGVLLDHPEVQPCCLVGLPGVW